MSTTDVLIIGAGPAGLFTALELGRAGVRTLAIDAGGRPEHRECPALDGKRCSGCVPCRMLSGAGGAGLYADGKLTLDVHAGGHLAALLADDVRLSQIIEGVEDDLVRLDGQSVRLRASQDEIRRFEELSAAAGLDFEPRTVRHMGTLNLRQISTRLVDLVETQGTQFMFDTRVTSLSRKRDGFEAKTADGQILAARRVVLAVGKVGSGWLTGTLAGLGSPSAPNRCFAGFRIEGPADSMDRLFTASLDPKLSRTYSSGRRVRTHCACRLGRVAMFEYGGHPMVGGHSYFARKQECEAVLSEPRSNVAVLASMPATWRFDEFSDFAARLGIGHVVAQRFTDLLDGSRRGDHTDFVAANLAENVTPADLRALMQGVDGWLDDCVDFVTRLGQIAPGLVSDRLAVYAPAAEWFMDRAAVDSNMQTAIPGLYAAGDGAGITQGIVHAAASGIVAARGVLDTRDRDSKKALPLAR